MEDSEEQKVEALRAALIEGEESGGAGPLDTEKIKRDAQVLAGLPPTMDE
ncbi:MAG: type II toxin-antitoxin system ParD family antitoxin [Planctomycetota bacterium]